MNNLRMLPVWAIIVCLIVFMIVPAPATALKTLRLNLDDKDKLQDEDDLTDFSAKYEEVLQEINISGDALCIVENIQEVMENCLDLTADIRQTLFKGDRVDEVTGRLMVSRTGNLVARLELEEPSALRGIIIVVDEECMQGRMYMPVTNEIRVQRLEEMGEEVLSFVGIADLTTLFDYSQYEVQVLERKEKDGAWDYLLQLSGLDQTRQQVRVNSNTWVPYEISEFDGEFLVGVLELNNVVLNQALDPDGVKDLPKVKEFVL